MAQKALTQEKVEELRSLRSEGLSVHEVATRAGVSEGAVSNYTREIAKPARVKKEVPPGRREGKDIMEPVAGAKLDTETTELANRLRKARLQQELDDIDGRQHQRQEVEDMRLRERRILLELDTARQGAAKGDSAVVGELTELRRELGELRESRHQAELRQIEDRHSSDMRRMEQLVAGSHQTGLGAYDIMAKSLDKAENLALMAGGKLDSFMKGSREDKQLMLGLQLGLTPAEFQLLQRGEELVPSREDFELGRRFRAHRDGVPYEEPEPGEFEGLTSLIQQGNRRWAMVQEKAARAMGQGGSQVIMTGKAPGQVPTPGEPEPAVLKAESKLVTCSRCGTTFDIDLVEARQAAAGKKLFVHCANPKCAFMLDLKDLVPELKPAEDKSLKPYCYVAGQDGQCDSELRGPDMCINCQWFKSTIVPMVYG